MRLILFALFAVIIFSGSTPTSPDIFEGNVIEISKAPWQVSIELSNGNHQCGGTIISDYWIVSAAHCFRAAELDLTIHAGASVQTDNSSGQRIEAEAIFIHPEFLGGADGGNDLCLIKLCSPLTFNSDVQAIPYANETNTSLADIAVGESLYLTGYGRYNFGPFFSDSLRELTLPIIPNSVAQTYLNSAVGDTYLSLFDIGLNKSAMPGDSGGPAVINPDSNPILVGVSSWGESLHQEKPTMYTNVRLYSNWIATTISEYDNMNSDIFLTEELDENNNIIPITNQRFYNNDVIIPSGNHIIVETGGYLRLNSGVSITVEHGAKLEVRNNGRLGSNPCVNKWKGVIVEGAINNGTQPAFNDDNLLNNNSGVIYVHTGGKILDAEIGIYSYGYASSSPFPSTFSSYTGAIYLDDATLENNDYGIIVDRKSPNPISDLSFVRYSVITSGIGGIRLRGVDNVSITQSEILNMTE